MDLKWLKATDKERMTKAYFVNDLALYKLHTGYFWEPLRPLHSYDLPLHSQPMSEIFPLTFNHFILESRSRTLLMLTPKRQ